MKKKKIFFFGKRVFLAKKKFFFEKKNLGVMAREVGRVWVGEDIYLVCRNITPKKIFGKRVFLAKNAKKNFFFSKKVKKLAKATVKVDEGVMVYQKICTLYFTRACIFDDYLHGRCFAHRARTVAVGFFLRHTQASLTRYQTFLFWRLGGFQLNNLYTWYGEKIFEKFWEKIFGKISLTWCGPAEPVTKKTIFFLGKHFFLEDIYLVWGEDIYLVWGKNF